MKCILKCQLPLYSHSSPHHTHIKQIIELTPLFPWEWLIITTWWKCGNSVRFIFLGSKIKVDGDYSHEIKRCLILGRISMSNLDSVLKSRVVTLSTKAHIVKAMVFPVVMHGCERWTIKKAEHRRTDTFKLLEKTLESPLDSKEIKPVNPKGNQSWIFIGRTDAEGETPILWPPDRKRVDSLEMTLMLGKIEGKRRRGWQRMRWLEGVTDSMDMSLSKRRETDSDGQRSLACCSSQGHKESDMT